MELLSFMLLQSGEQHTREILRRIYQEYEVVEIVRKQTTPRAVFCERMLYVYKKIAPAKRETIEVKAASQHNRTSYLMVICRGEQKNNKAFKMSIRELTGVNCIHSSDGTESTIKHLEYLLGYSAATSRKYLEAPIKKIDLDRVYDFLYWEFEVEMRKPIGHFSSLQLVFDTLHEKQMSYVILNIGNTLEVLINKRKDIEFITHDRVGIVDLLKAEFYHKHGMQIPHESTHHIMVAERLVKLDFCIGVYIPVSWRNHILATRVFNGEYFEPMDIDRYWLTVYDRTVTKPKKFGEQARYKGKSTWTEVIMWGNRLGACPKIAVKHDLEYCQKAVKEYVDKIGT